MISVDLKRFLFCVQFSPSFLQEYSLGIKSRAGNHDRYQCRKKNDFSNDDGNSI